MDDLDHSIHIAECDWTCFYEESEECCFLQPSLAGLENSSLSDSEESGSPGSPALETGQLDLQRGTDTTTFQTSAGGLCKAEECYSELSAQINQRGSDLDLEHDLTVQTKEGSGLLQSTVALENSLESQRDFEICLQYHGEIIRNSKSVQGETAEGITQVTDHSRTNYMLTAQHNESANVQCSSSDGAHDTSESTDLQKADGEIKRESGTIDLTFIQEPASLIGQHAELNVNKLHNTDRTVSVGKTDSSVAPTTEKERWFVTVNDSPLRQRVPAGATKKKRRKKKPFKNTDPMCSDGPELLLVCGPELQRDEANESEAEEDNEHFTKSHQNSEMPPSAQISPKSSQKGLISESTKMYITSPPFNEENVSQKLSLEMSSFTPTVPTESYTDNSKCDTYCSAISLEKPVSLKSSAIHDTFTLRDENTTSQDDVESEDLEDSAECFSISSYDSENYLSATESTTEEPEHIIKDCLTEQQPADLKQLPQQCTLSPTTLSNLFMFPEMADVHNTKDTEMYLCDVKNVHFSAVSNDEASTTQSSLEKYSPEVYMPQQSKGHEDTVDQDYAKPAMTFPFTGQSMSIMPGEDNSTSDNEKHSSASHVSLEAPRVHKPPTDNKPFAHSDLVKAQPESPPIPDFTVTPCSASESPETYAESLGPNRPVYAISAFWDEMEKLTIKDILQLRMARSPSPKELNIQGTARPQVDVLSDTQTSSSVDTAEYLLPDSALMDTSDTTDSDYFTQLDDSKQDRSSCEFSISDFDEEYWQFIGASRNPTPEPQDLKQQSPRTTESPCLSDLQEKDTDCMGKETPVDIEQLAGQCFEDHPSNSLISNEILCPGAMTKRKSMHNIHAHDAEIQDVPLESILEKRLLSNCPATEENMCVMLRTRTPPPILSYTDILDENYQISFPEIFEYLFMEDEPKTMSEADMYDNGLTQYEREMYLPQLQHSQCSEGKPIPIFSCSHPPVRDLTFPELDYLFPPQDPYAESEEEDACSPILVVSRSHIQTRDSAYFSAAPDGPLLHKRGWLRNWTSLFSLRKVRFPVKGRSWCRRSGAWVFSVEDQKMPSETASQATMLNERKVTSFPSQIFRDSAAQQRLFRSTKKTLSLSRECDLEFYVLMFTLLLR